VNRGRIHFLSDGISNGTKDYLPLIAVIEKAIDRADKFDRRFARYSFPLPAAQSTSQANLPQFTD
jgi:hypothetical protein